MLKYNPKNARDAPKGIANNKKNIRIKKKRWISKYIKEGEIETFIFLYNKKVKEYNWRGIKIKL